MATYVVCIDGTWNRPADHDGDPINFDIETAEETNVHRVFRFLADEAVGPAIRNTRVAPFKLEGKMAKPGELFYVTGVGTSGNWVVDRFAGATGYGTMKRILLAYQFLAERCGQNDRIVGFGFSRGAYAVRSLAGLLHHVGLPPSPRPLGWGELRRIGRRYRRRRTTPPGIPGFRPAKVHFLGLWDTVGALAFKGDDTSFHEISPPNVNHVAHALALDELRQDFEPAYWGHQTSSPNVEEVWFAGVHSNIGGGYDTTHLSNIALAWMVARAVEADLLTSDAYIPGWYHEHTFGQIKDSYEEYLSFLWRLGDVLKRSPQARKLQSTQQVHRSVLDRIRRLKSSLYVTVDEDEDKRVKRDPYQPAARIGDGLRWADDRIAFKGRVAETEDYLDKVLARQRSKGVASA